MPFNRFDVSTKELIWDDPAAVLERLGIGLSGPVTVVWLGCGQRTLNRP